MGARPSQMPEEGSCLLPTPLFSLPLKGLGEETQAGKGAGPQSVQVVLGGEGLWRAGDQTRDKWDKGHKTICQNPQLSDSKLN